MSSIFLLTAGDDQFTISPDLQTDVLALGGNDWVIGSSVSDTINGNQGNDTLQGLGGGDRIWGGQDFDSIEGGEGADTLNGNRGFDFVNGDGGNDILRGGQDADLLVGGVGNDSIFGDRGTDFLAGNGGSDVLVLSFISPEADPFGAEADTILDFQGTERDRIGLPPGLTEADLLLTPVTVVIDDVLSDELLTAVIEVQNLGFTPDQLRALLTPAAIRQVFQDFTGVDVDPNGNGIIEGTEIRIAATGQIIGRSVNTTASDLAGGFITLSPDELALG
ncbi:MAG: calcium-binding protein [Oscillatoriales cyanobacterium RM1_1_9]|nr:calcium-binding protein [Oscillatoriales cyanobacterium SM2_3_0]NJO45410.1 calcium-binding protein [Oscillatoriales cyanobacterium RM2_1_1]NJO72012.1 calcium-binding protein [Oscillatoriales cyanobacterium RM1_1_9]